MSDALCTHINSSCPPCFMCAVEKFNNQVAGLGLERDTLQRQLAQAREQLENARWAERSLLTKHQRLQTKVEQLSAQVSGLLTVARAAVELASRYRVPDGLDETARRLKCAFKVAEAIEALPPGMLEEPNNE